MSDSYDSMEVAHQALLSMGFSRQEYPSGLPFPSLGQGASPLPIPFAGMGPVFLYAGSGLESLGKAQVTDYPSDKL